MHNYMPPCNKIDMKRTFIEAVYVRGTISSAATLPMNMISSTMGPIHFHREVHTTLSTMWTGLATSVKNLEGWGGKEGEGVCNQCKMYCKQT